MCFYPNFFVTFQVFCLFILMSDSICISMFTLIFVFFYLYIQYTCISMLAIIFVFVLWHYITQLNSAVSVRQREASLTSPYGLHCNIHPYVYVYVYVYMYVYKSSFCIWMYDCCAHIIAVQCWADWHLYVHVYVYTYVYDLSWLTFPAKQLTPNCHCGRHSKTQILPIILYNYLCVFVFVFVFVLIFIWQLYLQPIVYWWRKPNTPWILPNLPN